MDKVSLPQDPIPVKEFEQSLLKTLALGKIDDKVARQLVTEISSIEVLRQYPVRPFTKGIIAPDGITIRVMLDGDGLATLVKHLAGSKALDRFDFFPYGIINPEVFVGRLDFRA